MVNSLKLSSHWSILLIPERPRGLLQALLQEEGRDQLQDHQDQGDAAPGQRGAVHCQGGPQGLLDTIYCQDPGKAEKSIYLWSHTNLLRSPINILIARRLSAQCFASMCLFKFFLYVA